MANKEVDVVVVGAGFAGMYMLVKLRELGLSAHCFEAGGDVGGTWYWNRYPGARCDIESLEYSYSFSPELEQEWTWTERYATQPEILRYARHVADRFDLRPDITFDTKVEAAAWDEDTERWTVETSGGETLAARFFIMATGCLSSPNRPDIPGLDDFAGETYLTGLWPHEGVDFSGKRVAVIGTGSSAVQSIPVIAREADHVTVFQRTPNYIVPAQNHDWPDDTLAEAKANYRQIRAEAKEETGGFRLPHGTSDRLVTDVPETEREQEFQKRWDHGGLVFLAAYPDEGLFEESADFAGEFVRRKIRERVKDPETAEKLCPDDHPFGSKRLCVDIGYFETYNEDHVDLVDLKATPIERITASGVRTTGGDHDADILVLATGFDAMTGTLTKFDIRGEGGTSLREKWEAGPLTYLGLMSAGFPNFFMLTGPGSPSVLSNMMVSIEQHVEYVADILADLQARGGATIVPLESAEEAWVQHGNDTAAPTNMMRSNSWYLGANIPGKPRVFMPYSGGVPTYRRICDHLRAEGYPGFAIDGEANETPVAFEEFADVPEVLVPILEAMAAEAEAAAGTPNVQG